MASRFISNIRLPNASVFLGFGGSPWVFQSRAAYDFPSCADNFSCAPGLFSMPVVLMLDGNRGNSLESARLRTESPDGVSRLRKPFESLSWLRDSKPFERDSCLFKRPLLG